MSKAKVTVGQAPAGDTAQTADTFSITLQDGTPIICGRPQGVLQTRIRKLLDPADRTDQLLVTQAQAFLCIRSFGGERPVLTSPGEFEALVQRFGTDAELARFLEAYQRFINPEAMSIVDKALQEALDQGLGQEATERLVTKAAIEYARQRRDEVRD